MILMISFTIRGQGHDNAYKTQYLFVYLQLLTIIRNYIFEIFTNAVKAMHMFTKRNYCLFVYIQLLTIIRSSIYYMSVKSSTELMLYVVLTMPTLNKAYLLLFIIYLLIVLLIHNHS